MRLCNVLIFSALRKVAFWLLKDHLLQPKRIPFTSQNVAFYIHAAFAMPFLLRQQTFRLVAFRLSVHVSWSMFRQWFLCLVPMFFAVMSVNSLFTCRYVKFKTFM
ncbi:hypothetical protein ACU52_10320 [Xylanibacter rarus]|uniref:Uncharacterized protein n=1 Tax=Xylanibacter rarus TaxID=1676614 RepID=A0A8E1QWX6_9BACT|nr:hypothetical protein ACU52_10320 [Xylanibacter rarus]